MNLACHIAMWSTLFIVIFYSTPFFLRSIFSDGKKKSVYLENLTDSLKWNSTYFVNFLLTWNLILQHFVLWYYILLYLFHHICISLCTVVNNSIWIFYIWSPVTRKIWFLPAFLSTDRCCSQENAVCLSVTEICSGWYFL